MNKDCDERIKRKEEAMERACSDTVVELANCKSDLVILVAEKSTWITREKELKDNIR